MVRRALPVGVDNFEKLIGNNYYYVDKTLLIKELLDKKGDVNLFTRPRRFGKSLNLSMLRYYFENVSIFNKDNSSLFKGLKIMDAGEDYTKELGKYPVISLSLKSAKQPTFDIAYHLLFTRIQEEYYYHEYLLDSSYLNEAQKDRYRLICNGKVDYKSVCESIQFLSQCLFKHHQQKVIILIDEYDVPLENAYFEEKRGERDFYRKMVSFIRSLFESALKTNEVLQFAVVTGCLRITKESIFTGLNNLTTNSILTDNYGEYFGFTQTEVDKMLVDYHQEAKKELVKSWYNGYRFGSTEVYNPWSVINFVDSGESIPKPYWSNTSSNLLVKDLIERADSVAKREIEDLISGKTIEKAVHEEITYEDMYQTQDNLWNFLFFTGYLKQIGSRMEDRNILVNLAIPNEEVAYVYENMILNWFETRLKNAKLTKLHQAILSGDCEIITEEINKYLSETISFYDQGESFYQGFMLGLLKSMENTLVMSNRESGNGRYDIVIKIPSVKTYDQAIILELKVAKSLKELETTSQKALQQIEEREYAKNLYDEGYEVIGSYGVAFFRKKCFLVKD